MIGSGTQIVRVTQNELLLAFGFNLRNITVKFHPRIIMSGIWLNDVSTYSSLTPHA